MEYNDQINWLEYRVQELKMAQRKSPETFTADRELKALVHILQGYKKAYEDSITLSWTVSPDRMGR